MSILYRGYCRTFQFVMRTFTKILPWRDPELLTGKDSLRLVAKRLTQEGLSNILIVTDEGITKLGLINDLLSDLNMQKVKYVIYDKTCPNPTIENIEAALELYHQHHCQAIIAFGGGSPIDCAKGVGARVARPSKSIPQMKGIFKTIRKLPPLYAVPTTAGTGSEATIAAVVSNRDTHEKYALMDTCLMPKLAILDPMLTINLPPHLTATTGIDALTHAVEAYIGKSNTQETEAYCLEAVKLIFENLPEAYTNGTNLHARAHMQKASYIAGKAFTRAYVGYVHAIAHTLGGFYQVPHGLANAIVLPHVLKYYGDAAHERLGQLADEIGLTKPTDTDAQKAQCFIEAIQELNKQLAIPSKYEGISEIDIPLMVERAHKEANPLYPVPRILNREDLYVLYRVISN